MPQGAFASLLHPLYRRLERSAHVLRYLFLEVTQRCNLRCRHCGSDCGSDPRLAELSTEEWLRFFPRLASSFDRRELFVVVTGGEPCCRPQIDELLAGLRANGLTWGMVSNGWALDGSRVERLVAHGMASLTISLDGLRASHDWLRGREGSHERAIAAIRHAVAARLPCFDVVTCVNPRNLHELPEVLGTLRALGVPAWRLFCIFPRGRAKGDAELALGPEQMRELFAWIAAQRARAGEGDPRVEFSCEGYLPPVLDRAVREQPYFCRAGINIASVLCDGAISACPNISRGLVQGNIRTDDLARVWEERFQPFRDRTWMKQGRCGDCAEWRRCQGNSLHLWDDEAAAPAVCHHAILAADR